MSRVVHFEIQAEQPQRAVEFYTGVFGWTSEDWSEYAGSPYFGLSSLPTDQPADQAGDQADQPGINGAVMQRPGANPEVGGVVAGAVLTIGVADFDTTAAKILQAGGSVALPKFALPGMAWQGYFHDTENNVFGIHQPDPEAA